MGKTHFMKRSMQPGKEVQNRLASSRTLRRLREQPSTGVPDEMNAILPAYIIEGQQHHSARKMSKRNGSSIQYRIGHQL